MVAGSTTADVITRIDAASATALEPSDGVTDVIANGVCPIETDCCATADATTCALKVAASPVTTLVVVNVAAPAVDAIV